MRLVWVGERSVEWTHLGHCYCWLLHHCDWLKFHIVCEWVYSMYLHTIQHGKNLFKMPCNNILNRTLSNKTSPHQIASGKCYRTRKWDHSYPMPSCMHGDMILERRGQYGKRQCAKKTPNTRCNQMNETQTEKEWKREKEKEWKKEPKHTSTNSSCLLYDCNSMCRVIYCGC